MFQKIIYLKNVRFLRNYSSYCSKIGVLGVEFERGSCYKGSSRAPKLLKEFGLITLLKNISHGVDVREYENISYETKNGTDSVPMNMGNYSDVISITEQISNICCNIIKEGRICVTLGGDHSISIGTVNGHIKAKTEENVAVLWIDAHADLNTNSSSETGNIHGMSVAILAKELKDYWPNLSKAEWHKPRLSLRNVAYIGLRSIDNFEQSIIEELGITAFGMRDVEKYGINTVINMALDKIDPQNKRSLHVSFDIDALDALEAPSTILPVRGGLTLRESIHMLETIHSTRRLGALDLVEINPTVGNEMDLCKTLQAACEIILAAFGQSTRSLRELRDK